MFWVVGLFHIFALVIIETTRLDYKISRLARWQMPIKENFSNATDRRSAKIIDWRAKETPIESYVTDWQSFQRTRHSLNTEELVVVNGRSVVIIMRGQEHVLLTYILTNWLVFQHNRSTFIICNKLFLGFNFVSLWTVEGFDYRFVGTSSMLFNWGLFTWHRGSFLVFSPTKFYLCLL